MPDTGTVYNWRLPVGGDILKIGVTAIRNLATDIATTITSVADRVTVLEAARPMAILRQTTVQSGLVSGWHKVIFQTEDKDTHNGHDPAVNPTRWTCPAGQGGTYEVSGTVTFSAMIQCNVRIAKNGVAVPNGCGTWGSSQQGAVTGVKLVDLVPNDYVEVEMWSTVTFGTTTYPDNASSMTLRRVA